MAGVGGNFERATIHILPFDILSESCADKLTEDVRDLG